MVSESRLESKLSFGECRCWAPLSRTASSFEGNAFESSPILAMLCMPPGMALGVRSKQGRSPRVAAGRKGVLTMHYRPKSVAALQICLAGLPDRMRVEVDPDIEVSAKTVGELRNVTVWSDHYAIATPQDRDPKHSVKVSKASHATRTSPKP